MAQLAATGPKACDSEPAALCPTGKGKGRFVETRRPLNPKPIRARRSERYHYPEYGWLARAISL